MFTPAQVGDLERFSVSTLHDGDELQPFCFHLVPEKAIQGPAVLLIGGVDRAQDVEIDSMLTQECPSLHHAVKRAPLTTIHAILIVKLTRPVDTQAHKEVVFLEKSAPLIVEEDPVGLKRVSHDLISSAVLLHQFHGLSEEVEFHEGRFATLPCDRNFRCAMRFKQLPDVSFQRSL